MKQIYIFTLSEPLDSALSNLLDILGYLPIKVINFNKKKKLNSDIIFTNYTCLPYNKEFLNRFKNVIVFTPNEETYLDRETIIKNYSCNIIFFYKTLTVKNIQALLHDIENK